MINQGLHPLTITNVHHAMVRHAFLCVDHEHRAPSQPFAQSTPDIDQPVSRVQKVGCAGPNTDLYQYIHTVQYNTVIVLCLIHRTETH